MRPRKNDRHLPACMFYRHGAYYYVKRGEWRRLGKDLPTAMSEYARLVENNRRGGGMADLIDKALAAMSKDLKPNTIAQYTIAANKLKTVLVEFAPEQVRPKDVAAIKAHYASTPAMANRMISFLRSVFAYAVEWQIVDANPCVGIRRHKESPRDRLISPDEFAAIKAAARHRAITVVMDLCYLTGQRIGDVLAIRNADIGDDGIRFTQEKTGARLLVAMTDDLKAVLAEARRIHPPHERADTLLYTRGFRPYSYGTIKDAFNRAKETAGIADVTIHDLRAMSITAVDDEGGDAQRLAGHTTGAQTKRYIRHRKMPVANSPKMPRQKG